MREWGGGGKFWKENGGLGLLIWYTLIIRVKMVVTLNLNSKPDLKKKSTLIKPYCIPIEWCIPLATSPQNLPISAHIMAILV